MGKKIKVDTSKVNINVGSEDEPSFEVSYDEESNEMILTFHLRKKWGDLIDESVDEFFDVDSVRELLGVITLIYDSMCKRAKGGNNGNSNVSDSISNSGGGSSSSKKEES
jgi:hypothetical protein